MIVRVVAEGEADGAVTEVPITPLTTCRDVVECCRDPGDEPCCLVGTCLDKDVSAPASPQQADSEDRSRPSVLVAPMAVPKVGGIRTP
ncbi:Apoptosis-stimulating of p53 protein 1 [Frankliniella fusca]|uniref:Apoptosis-stimulating of p53 protein 1 n=1 Tax=Frankliniella fusca TaxID=407009 RepID=A0AAE1L9G6_9NEOP|nr:Apoptosis-stimulating of p53 protein 1 [Frankliniella fusca]